MVDVGVSLRRVINTKKYDGCCTPLRLVLYYGPIPPIKYNGLLHAAATSPAVRCFLVTNKLLVGRESVLLNMSYGKHDDL